MGLPATRDLSFIDGLTKIPASVMNNIQDCIVAFSGATFGVYGNGFDGDVVLDGVVAAPSGMTKVGTVYTMTRHFFARNLTVTGAGVQVNTAGWHLYASVSITTDHADAIVSLANAGSNGVASVGGAGGAQSYTSASAFFQVHANQQGATGANSGGSVLAGPPGVPQSYGGAGGAGGNGDSAGGAISGANTQPTALQGTAHIVLPQMTGWMASTTGGALAWNAVYGGQGGAGGGGGTAGAAGGGGGGGGGVLMVAAPTITCATAADIRAAGGKGGNASTGGDGNAGGGGGGGGGVFFAFYHRCNVTFAAATNCPGGAGGTGGGGGAGFAGSAGSAGTVFARQMMLQPSATIPVTGPSALYTTATLPDPAVVPLGSLIYNTDTDELLINKTTAAWTAI